MVSTPHIENQSNINGRKHELDLSPFLYPTMNNSPMPESEGCMS